MYDQAPRAQEVGRLLVPAAPHPFPRTPSPPLPPSSLRSVLGAGGKAVRRAAGLRPSFTFSPPPLLGGRSPFHNCLPSCRLCDRLPRGAGGYVKCVLGQLPRTPFPRASAESAARTAGSLPDHTSGSSPPLSGGRSSSAVSPRGCQLLKGGPPLSCGARQRSRRA